MSFGEHIELPCARASKSCPSLPHGCSRCIPKSSAMLPCTDPREYYSPNGIVPWPQMLLGQLQLLLKCFPATYTMKCLPGVGALSFYSCWLCAQNTSTGTFLGRGKRRALVDGGKEGEQRDAVYRGGSVWN